MVLVLRAQQVERYGGPHGILDQDVVLSGVARPRNRWACDDEADLADLAAAYMVGFAGSEGFNDGNKRVGLASALVFLRLNGYALHVPNKDLYALTMQIANNEADDDIDRPSGTVLHDPCAHGPPPRGPQRPIRTPVTRAPFMRLDDLLFYPIKSCRGTSLDRARVGPRGIEGDRGWMVVTPEGRFLTQRVHPRLALIEPGLGEAELEVRAPGMAVLRLERWREGPTLDVDIWRDRCHAVDQGDDAAEWFSSFLGTRVRFVRQSENADRPVDPDFARTPSDQVSLADGFPFLLIGEASLADLNARLAETLPMDRFRPNLVVAGGAPFAEDAWRVIRIGDLVFDVVKPCARCVVTTVDQDTGEKGKEPLRTLAEFRRDIPGAPPGSSGNVYFGQNLIHRGRGTLTAGTEVEVLEEARPAP